MPARAPNDSARAAESTKANQERRIVGDAPSANTVSDTRDNGNASSNETADAPKKGEASSVTAIRTWNADDYTRVVVDLNGAVKYQSARIKNPDRIYFDLYQAHLGHSLTDKELAVQNGFLRSVRVAQNKSGTVRLVLDVRSIQGYSAFLLPNPYRLVIDVHGAVTDASAKNSAPAVTAPRRLAGDQPAASAAPLASATEKVEVSSTSENSDSGGPNPASAIATHSNRADRNMSSVSLLPDKPTRD